MKTIAESLDNGLTVLLRPMPHAPAVSVWVGYKVGSRDERPGLTGAAHRGGPTVFQRGRGEQSQVPPLRGAVRARVPRAPVPLARDRVEVGSPADPAGRAVRLLPPALRAEQRGPRACGPVRSRGRNAESQGPFRRVPTGDPAGAADDPGAPAGRRAEERDSPSGHTGPRDDRIPRARARPRGHRAAPRAPGGPPRRAGVLPVWLPVRVAEQPPLPRARGPEARDGRLRAAPAAGGPAPPAARGHGPGRRRTPH